MPSNTSVPSIRTSPKRPHEEDGGSQESPASVSHSTATFKRLNAGSQKSPSPLIRNALKSAPQARRVTGFADRRPSSHMRAPAPPKATKPKTFELGGAGPLGVGNFINVSSRRNAGAMLLLCERLLIPFRKALPITEALLLSPKRCCQCRAPATRLHTTRRWPRSIW